MDSLEIHAILSKDPYCKRYFIGVFPADKLPNSLPLNCAFVVNADKSTSSGSHWFSLFKKGRNCYIFDSFGRLPQFLFDYCRRHDLRITYNSLPHQTSNEITCGGYCVYVLCALARGKNFRSILRTFMHIRHDDSFIRRYLVANHNYHLRPT